jgi:hypothetical protein
MAGADEREGEASEKHEFSVMIRLLFFVRLLSDAFIYRHAGFRSAVRFTDLWMDGLIDRSFIHSFEFLIYGFIDGFYHSTDTTNNCSCWNAGTD